MKKVLSGIEDSLNFIFLIFSLLVSIIWILDLGSFSSLLGSWILVLGSFLKVIVC